GARGLRSEPREGGHELRMRQDLFDRRPAPQSEQGPSALDRIGLELGQGRRFAQVLRRPVVGTLLFLGVPSRTRLCRCRRFSQVCPLRVGVPPRSVQPNHSPPRNPTTVHGSHPKTGLIAAADPSRYSRNAEMPAKESRESKELRMTTRELNHYLTQT